MTDLYEDAACKGLKELFYSYSRPAQQTAAAICETCPVKSECETLWRSLPLSLRCEGVWAGHNVVRPRRSGSQARPGRRPFAQLILDAVPDEWMPGSCPTYDERCESFHEVNDYWDMPFPCDGCNGLGTRMVITDRAAIATDDAIRIIQGTYFEVAEQSPVSAFRRLICDAIANRAQP